VISTPALTPRRAVAAATGVAMVSCLAALGSQPLSWDEAVTANAAERTPGALWWLLSHTDAPLGAYYLFMNGWVRALHLLGVAPSDGWLRLPSALAAVGSVALTAALATHWLGPRAGLVAGTLLAVHPLFVFYAHDARPYTFATLFILASTIALVRALDRPNASRLCSYAAAAIMAIYAHLFACLVLAAQAIAIARNRAHRWRFAWVGLAVGLAAVPLVWIGSRETNEVGWIPRPSAATVASFAARVGGGAMLVPMLCLVALAAVPAIRRFRDRSGDTPVRTLAVPLLLAGWALLPPLGLILASFLKQPIIVARYALVAVPAQLITATAAARRIGRRGAAVLATAFLTAAFLAAAVTSAVQQAKPFKYEDFRSAAYSVADTAQSGDGLVFVPAAFRVGFDRYLRTGHGDPGRSPVADVALQSEQSVHTSEVIGGQECDEALLPGRIVAHDRIYLVGDTLSEALDRRGGPTELAKERVLRDSYSAVWSRRFGVVTVTLFVRQRPG